MRSSLLGHLVDTGRNVIGSLLAMIVWATLVHYFPGWGPRVTVSIWWIAFLLVLAASVVWLSWYRSRPYEVVYNCFEPPMETGEGEIMPDSGSHAPFVWHVDRRGNRGPAALFGPYVTLQRGSYLARFRLKIARHGPQGYVVLDIAHGHYTSDVLPIGGREFPISRDTEGSYRPFPVRFEINKDLTDHQLEWRVRVEGPDTEVWADTVTIRRIG